MLRRLSTLTFGRRAASHLPNGAKLTEALHSPLIVDILETMDAHESAIFFILGPVQFFKTAVGQLRLARNHALRPREAAWYSASGDFSKDFADFKLNPLLDAQPQFLPHNSPPGRGDLILEDKNKLSRLRRTYATGSHVVLSAQTENDRTGKTFVDLYLDEPHLYEPGWIQQIENRRKDYEDEFTETLMSTGLTIGQTARGGEAAALWATTDQRLWHVRCPHCHQLFEPRYLHREKENDPESPIIGGLLYARTLLENGLPDESAIAATLVYQCPRCRVARLPDTHGSRVSLSGSAARPLGIYVSQNAHAAPRRFGWNFNAIAGRAWIKIVMDFELAQLARRRGDIEPLGRVVREHFGGLWDPEQHLRTSKSKPAGDYLLGDEWPDEALDPEGRPVRALTCDVQMDHFVVTIRMWSRNGASRLRWAEKVTTPARVRDLAMAHRVIPERVYLDARHEGEYVRRTASAFGWRVLLGEKDKDFHHKVDGSRRIYSEPRLINAYQGTAQAPQYVAQINFSKQSVLTRLHLIRTLPSVGPMPMWTAAKDAPDWYFKEIDAHYRVKQHTPEGQPYWVWHGLHDDHAGDCEAMQIVFASMAGLIGSESLETRAEDQRPETKDQKLPAAA